MIALLLAALAVSLIVNVAAVAVIVRQGSTVVVTTTSGDSIRGRRRWHPRGVRLRDAEALTGQDAVPIKGEVLIPHRAVVMVQVVA